jgi:plasmid stabilization system protein ParE
LIVDLNARLDQIAAINTSFNTFGRAASARYARLILGGYDDLRRSPDRTGSILFENGVYLYHLRHSARKMKANKVMRPRHVIVCRFDDERLQIIALLHDSMDIPMRLSRSSNI